ncbi:MAG: molybdopterin molybdotransferase MoeA [Burkholderiales bacterium]|nr:molybdopterin molybdotransferase MoeA [Burkholderiales bacterium]
MNTLETLSTLAAAEDYDPNSMPVEKARAFIRQTLSPVCGVERVALKCALHRVLAEPIVSPINVPSFDNSAMDGYALLFADLHPNASTSLTRVGASFAGHPFEGKLNAGECARIMTGATIPEGADTVVMQERTTEENGTVRIEAGAVSASGQNCRRAGEDIKKGDTVFRAGVRITAPMIGMLASLGITEVSVYRKLRVAFFSNGDELTPIGAPLQFGKIYDSNRYALDALLTENNFIAIDLGTAPDDVQKLEEKLFVAAKNADVVMTIGGVSVGDADYIKTALKARGEILFWRIAMKPGRPLAFGVIDNAVFFGLPGNPVSAVVTFTQFVRDALLILQGQTLVPPLTFHATLTRGTKKAKGRTEFQRGFCETRDGKTVVTPDAEQGSGILSSMARANCFIVLPQDCGALPEGATVEILPI